MPDENMPDEIVEEVITEEVVEEPVLEEVKEVIEEEPVIEETVEPVVDYKNLYEAQQKRNDELTDQLLNPVLPPTPEPAPESSPIPDMYSEPEAFKKYMDKRDADTAANAVKAMMESPEMQTLQMTVGMREHELQKTATKEELGEIFDFEKDAEAIAELQQKYPGMQMNEAAKILKYNEVQTQNVKLKEGVVERKKAIVPPTNGATRTVQIKSEEQPTTQLNETQVAYAKKFFGNSPEALERYAKGLEQVASGGYLE